MRINFFKYFHRSVKVNLHEDNLFPARTDNVPSIPFVPMILKVQLYNNLKLSQKRKISIRTKKNNILTKNLTLWLYPIF